MGKDSPIWLWIPFVGAEVIIFLVPFFSLSALNIGKSNDIN